MFCKQYCVINKYAVLQQLILNYCMGIWMERMAEREDGHWQLDNFVREIYFTCHVAILGRAQLVVVFVCCADLLLGVGGDMLAIDCEKNSAIHHACLNVSWHNR